MNLIKRYHIILDENKDDVIIYDSQTGAVQHPVCWQDLVAYYNYLVGQGRINESQKLLAESITGQKPITKMLEHVSGTSQ